MPTISTVYRIFIASPSDTTEERKIIRNVIYEWNSTNSVRYNIILDPVAWESHSIPAIGNSPQEVLSKQLLPICDILVGVFRSRIGTTTKNAQSGTVDEIHEFIETNRPVILYFCNEVSSQDKIDLDQKTKLDEFKNSIKERGIVWPYNTKEELSHEFSRHLSLKINELQRLYKSQIIPEEFDGPNKSAVDRLVKYYQRVNIDWNVYRPTAQFNEGTLDRLEQAYEGLWNISNNLSDDETKKIKPKLLNALHTLRFVIDSGQHGPSFFSVFGRESKKKKEHDEFFSLLKDSITELKKTKQSENEQAN